MSIRLILSRWGVWITSSLAALAVLTAGPVRAQETVPPARPLHSGGPCADLGCVPADAAWLVSLRVADVWKSKPAGLMRRIPGLAEMLQHVPGMVGLTPAEIHRATLLQYRQDVACVLWLTKPVSRTRLVQLVAPHARQRQLNGRPFWINEEDWIGLALLDEKTVLVGKANDVEALVTGDKPCQGPLRPGLNAVAEGHDLVVAVNPLQLAVGPKGRRMNRDVALPFDLGEPRYRSLTHPDWVTIVADFKPRELTVETQLSYPSERLGRLAEQAIHPLRKEIQDALLAYRTQGPEEDGNPLFLAVERFARACTAGLHAMKVERQGTRVRTSLSVQCPETVLGLAFLAVNSNLGTMYSVVPSHLQGDRLAKLGLAMLEHHRKTGRLPARAITGPDGKPLLSWRVALLPYLGEKELYKQFHLDEPWDSDHNRPLIARMPAVFRTLDGDESTPTTAYQVFWGKDTVFYGKLGKRLRDLKDGPEQTILVVDAGRRVPWTKPEDVHVAADQSLPRFCQRPLRVVLADGRVVQLPGFSRGTPLNETHLRALISRHGADQAEAQVALAQAVAIPPQGTAPQQTVMPTAYQQPEYMPSPPTYMPPAPPLPQFVVPPGVPVPAPQMLPPPTMTAPPLPPSGPVLPPGVTRELLPMPTPIAAPPDRSPREDQPR